MERVSECVRLRSLNVIIGGLHGWAMDWTPKTEPGDKIPCREIQPRYVPFVEIT